jgi:addiction module HigA family antidote
MALLTMGMSPYDDPIIPRRDPRQIPRAVAADFADAIIAIMPCRKTTPPHPGEILHREFLVPLGITQHRLAKDTSVPPRRINEIVRGQRAISADTALRFARYFGTSERFWINLQSHYDLELEKERLGKRLDREVHVLANRSAES